MEIFESKIDLNINDSDLFETPVDVFYKMI